MLSPLTVTMTYRELVEGRRHAFRHGLALGVLLGVAAGMAVIGCLEFAIARGWLS